MGRSSPSPPPRNVSQYAIMSQTTTGGSVNEVIEILKENKCEIIGLAVLVDRSNGKIKLHKNQYSIASIDSSSYQELDLPKELARIPIQKPGSRFS